MPDVTPDGPLSVAIDGLRTLISNLSWFQTWTGAGNASVALASIFVGHIGYPGRAITVAGNVATVETIEPHKIQVGDVVRIVGESVGSQSSIGITTNLTVVSVPTSTSFTVSLTADPQTVYPDQFTVMPKLPLALIGEGQDALKSESVGTGGASIYAGSLDILLEADVSSSYVNDAMNALYEARNAFGGFVQSLITTQGTGDLMCLNAIEPVMAPEFVSTLEQADNTHRFEKWRAMVRVTWGLNG